VVQREEERAQAGDGRQPMVPFRQRAYNGPVDLQAMAALVQAFPADHLHVVDLPYRFSSWALDVRENVGLWTTSGGQLLAWAVMQTPFWTIDDAYHPDAGEALRRQVWAWADGRAREMLDTPNGRDVWFVNVFADQAERIADLEAAGFACQAEVGEHSWSKVLMVRAAGTPVAECPPPAGVTIRSLAGEAEVEAYVALHRAAFDSRNMTVEWRRRTLRRPEAVPDLDLVAVTADGRLVAFCVCWLDRQAEGPDRGQIEPLGVHPDWRNQRLGRAILSEGLRRLVRHGARQIYVETDKHRNAALALYESLGFRVVRDVLVYRKDYGPSP
jgi:mycothiol synthase